MQGGENNSLCVTVIMKFNHTLKCNREIVMNILQCLLNGIGHIHAYVKIYSAPRPMKQGWVVKYACKDIIKMCFERTLLLYYDNVFISQNPCNDT